MVHQPSTSLGYSQASDIILHAAEIKRVRDVLTEIYLRHFQTAGKEKAMSDIEKLLDRDYFMDSEQAKELGLIDDILVSRNQKP